jgi:aspartate aminotransferase
LREAIARKFERENGLTVGLSQIAVANGGKQIIFNALMATIDEGDEVILGAPYFVSYPEMVRLVGGAPVSVPCPTESGFILTPEALEAAITPRTKWLLRSQGSSPTRCSAGLGCISDGCDG